MRGHITQGIVRASRIMVYMTINHCEHHRVIVKVKQSHCYCYTQSLLEQTNHCDDMQRHCEGHTESLWGHRLRVWVHRIIIRAHKTVSTQDITVRLHKVIVCVSKNRCWGAQHNCERNEKIVMAFKSLLRTQTYSDHASHCENTKVTTSVRVKDKHSPQEGIYIYCQHQNKWLWTPHWNIVRSHSHCDDTKSLSTSHWGFLRTHWVKIRSHNHDENMSSHYNDTWSYCESI